MPRALIYFVVFLGCMGAYFQHFYFASTEQSRKNTVFLHNEFSRFFLGGGGGVSWLGEGEGALVETWSFGHHLAIIRGGCLFDQIW